MHAETLRNVLHWTKEFHQQLSKSLLQSAGLHENEGSRLLLDYLARHETLLSNVIDGFEHTGELKALNTWCYEYLEMHPTHPLADGEIHYESLNSQQIIETVMEKHQHIIELYRYLHAKAATPSTQELLENLMKLEEHEAMLMSQNGNRLDEM
ncbi:ATPase [Hahella sp. HN01]|uniref:ATPase n=1 Tax=Hahella sp. HN01 TaxID=2847262 RepID=UPI001C1E8E2E|nr:ATPase [Hahella sp. HN01]MBU6951343.1 ATPase [Hahella sp. HN01]